MEQSHLQDRISWGLNVAARHIGRNTDAYRPHGPDNPLAAANRFLRLPAAFSALDGKFTRPNAQDSPHSQIAAKVLWKTGCSASIAAKRSTSGASC